MLALTLSLSLAALRFQGAWECPDAAAVERELAELHATSTGDHRVELVSQDDAQELRLIDESDAILERRVLPPDRHCGRQAKVIAVLIASWESELALRALAPPAAATAVIPAGGAIVVEKSVSTVPETVTAPPPAVSKSTPPEQVPASSLEWRIGLGPFGAIADYEPALGGLIFASLKPSRSRWGGHLKAFAATGGSYALGPGTVSLERFGGSLGGSFALTREPLVIETELDFALSWLRAQGHGFRLNDAPSALDPGGSLGFLASWRGADFEPWLGTWVFAWPLAEHMQVSGTTLSRPVPPIDLVAGIGVSLHLR
jgi:hypothetical protein